MFIGKHAVAVFTIASALTGLGMGASGVYQLHSYESHSVGQQS